MTVKRASLFSEGFGYDDDGNPVKFIGHTVDMSNIKKDLDAVLENDDDQVGKPRIYLKAWQVV